ncbi:PolC-type DNA polymerase III [Siphonobacter sp. SORGH_AS_1065]|uniref:3'-5' exonuclease n=1 Tax=Siphonobacter sp. SORGH_AS_1065 TaxID=3041795 RepID=UPI00277D7480|nr:3'-5' exonuclease [Siphonobacter sp. SORGH_AS_1065]MDQ1088668.1 DNA polymerase-3 subunit epsilon [Siphonobacter sp. SORGH_AS_1065]
MPYLVLDLEMTGGEPGWNEIIQIGAVLCDDQWNELGTYLTNVYPENEEAFSEYSARIHGLTLDDLEDAPMIYDVIPEFEEWILEKLGRLRGRTQTVDNSQYLRDVIISGQSVINDINFLRFAYREEKLKWPFSNKLLDLHTLGYFTFEVLKANGKPTPKSLSLKAIAGYFGLEREDAEFHNALEDAQLTTQSFKNVFALAKKFKIQE